MISDQVKSLKGSKNGMLRRFQVRVHQRFQISLGLASHNRPYHGFRRHLDE